MGINNLLKVANVFGKYNPAEMIKEIDSIGQKDRSYTNKSKKKTTAKRRKANKTASKARKAGGKK